MPTLLIYSRLATGFAVLLLAIYEPSFYISGIISLMAYGLVSDFLDGYIARQMGISTIHLRKLDSTIDQFFWICIAIAIYIIAPAFYKDHAISITLLLSMEALAYIISFVRFKKVVATHAIASKLWVLTLLATFVDVLLHGNSSIIFTICFYIGILSRLEIIAILLLIKTWVSDIPSIYHAMQLRRGKDIKRNKLFNG